MDGPFGVEAAHKYRSFLLRVSKKEAGVAAFGFANLIDSLLNLPLCVELHLLFMVRQELAEVFHQMAIPGYNPSGAED